MKKRVLALLLCLLTAFSAAAEEEAPLKKRRTESGLFYVKADHRYFNNAGHFGVSRIKSGVRLLNAAIDALEPHIPVSLYLAESSRSHLIERTFPEDSEVYRYLLEHLHADQADHLKYTTYRQFCEYFYATDHHWNYRGSYQAYADIVYMLFGEDEPYLTPDEKVTLPVKFQGSFAKQERNPVSEELWWMFTVSGSS